MTSLQVCQQYGMGVLSWSPLAGGWLSGRFGTGKDNTAAGRRLPARYDLDDPANAAKLAAVDQLAELAEKAGHSLPELAMAFVLDHPAVTSAIIGPRTMDQLTSLLKTPKSAWTARSWTASTRSCRPGRTSTSPTAGGRHPG